MRHPLYKLNSLENRKKIFIVLLVLCALCFAVHYVLLYGTCNMDEPMVYAYCVEGTAVHYLLKTYIVQWGNAGLVFSLMWYFGWPMLQNMIADRKKHIEHDIDECSRLKEEAEKAYDEAMIKTSDLGKEKATIEESYKQSAKTDSERIVAEAQAKAERMKADAQMQFELKSSQARRNFEREVVAESIQKAREEITRRLASDSTLRDKLIDQSIAALEI